MRKTAYSGIISFIYSFVHSFSDCPGVEEDGKITGLTTAMEYMKSDVCRWESGTGSDITGLAPGTYYVRVRATDTTFASDFLKLTIKAFISATVTLKVENGS